MNSNHRDEIISKYVEKIRSEEMEFSQLRKQLELENIPQEEMDYIVQTVDRKVIKNLMTESKKTSLAPIFHLGVVMVIIGLAIPIGTFFGIIGNGTYWILPYGFIIAGIGLIAKGSI